MTDHSTLLEQYEALRADFERRTESWEERGRRVGELLEQLQVLEDNRTTWMYKAQALEGQLKALREDVRVAIEDILLLDSPEGDSPRSIAANLRLAVGSKRRRET